MDDLLVGHWSKNSFWIARESYVQRKSRVAQFRTDAIVWDRAYFQRHILHICTSLQQLISVGSVQQTNLTLGWWKLSHYNKRNFLSPSNLAVSNGFQKQKKATFLRVRNEQAFVQVMKQTPNVHKRDTATEPRTAQVLPLFTIRKMKNTTKLIMT